MPGSFSAAREGRGRLTCSKGRQLVTQAFPERTGWLCSKTAVNLSFPTVKTDVCTLSLSYPAHPLTHTLGRQGAEVRIQEG